MISSCRLVEFNFVNARRADVSVIREVDKSLVEVHQISIRRRRIGISNRLLNRLVARVEVGEC